MTGILTKSITEAKAFVVPEMVTGALLVLFGKVDTAIITLWIFMALDIVTGIIKAAYSKTLSSREMYNGACRKAMKLVIVIVAVYLDKYSGGTAFRLSTIGFMIATEGLSIIENAGAVIELPTALTKFIEALKTESTDQGGGDNA